MQLNITITKKNKEKVFKLIESILEDEIEEQTCVKQLLVSAENKKEAVSEINYLQIPKDIPNLKNAKVIVYRKEFENENKRTNSVGSWGQFNSFFPIKGALRILANYIQFTGEKSIKLDNFVELCLDNFRRKNYNELRGFPGSEKDTARGRFVWHFLATACEMGLISIVESTLDYEGMPSSLLDWDNVSITITREGLEFATLPNNILDNLSNQQVLTKEETNWIITFLKKIDNEGYKEYSLLHDIYIFLSNGHNGKDELWAWFQNNQKFIEYIKSWSRKAERGDQIAFEEQIKNLSVTFAGSKIAILRELGIINNKRNDYTIMGVLN